MRRHRGALHKKSRNVSNVPSPPGRGWREAPGEGPNFMESVPHPALRATFSRREKVSRSYFAVFVQSIPPREARSTGFQPVRFFC